VCLAQLDKVTGYEMDKQAMIPSMGNVFMLAITLVLKTAKSPIQQPLQNLFQ
jgi:hypothetical protein